MCGIAGIFLEKGHPNDKAVQILADAIDHRGPDSKGRLVRENGIFLHSRLSIIDLESGTQPIQNNNGSAIIANGEIYNYIELRSNSDMYDFQTQSDSELPLMLYNLKGAEFAEDLRGMYAAAILGLDGKSIHLARDPFGIKPLYYLKLQHGFAFASEAGALLDAGLVARNINAKKRYELLQLKFTTGAETIFSGINRVLPGETITFNRGQVNALNKISALPDFGPENWSEKDALKLLNDALFDSVNIHQRSDVPYGVFLSGGVDSSAILACMRELNEQPVQAFTVGFSNTLVFDEREHARRVAKAAGADFNAVEFSEDDFWNLLPCIAGIMDDPAADYAILPTYKLGAACHKSWLKVILCGEGGDELFAGYGRYRKLMRPWFLGGRNMRSRGVFDSLGILREAGLSQKSMLDDHWARESLPQRTKLQIAQAVDCAHWLPNDLLTKLDRCLMAHGVEGRTPFLDRKIADFALRLPDNLKVKPRMGKYLLRLWLDQNIVY